MTVHGLIVDAGEGFKVCYAEDAFYTLQTASGRWVCTSVGGELTKDRYQYIVSTAHGIEGDMELDPNLKANISIC